MKFIQILLKSLKWLAIITLAMVVILTVIYFYKPSLNKDLKEILAKDRKDTGNKKDNACYYIMGFNARKDKDAYETGLELSEIYRQFELNSDNIKLRIQSRKLVENSFATRIHINSSDIFYDFLNKNDIEILLRNRKVFQTERDKLAYLFDRYEQIKKTTYYQTPFNPHVNIHPTLFSHIKDYAMIDLALSIIEMTKNKNSISRIADDLSFFKNLINHSDDYLLTIFCKDTIEMYNKTINALISNSSFIESITPDLFKENIDIEKSLKGVKLSNIVKEYSSDSFSFMNKLFLVETEIGYNITNLNSVNIKSLWIALIVNKNQLLNDYYNNLVVLDNFFIQHSDDSIVKIENKDKSINTSILIYSNFLGMLFNYTYLSDLNGYKDLLHLKLLLKRNSIVKTNIPDYINSVSDSIRNPYTHQAMLYDAGENSIYFDGPQFEFVLDKTYTRKVYLD